MMVYLHLNSCQGVHGHIDIAADAAAGMHAVQQKASVYEIYFDLCSKV